MKRLLLLLILISGLTSSYSHAQMGHGMMREGHMMGQGSMMRPQERKLQENEQEQQLMQHRHMMNTMMGMTQDIAIMMRQMSVVMGTITDDASKMSRDRMQRMSILMKDMSAEMNRISDVMGKGSTSGEEIRVMQKKMLELQDQMWELKR